MRWNLCPTVLCLLLGLGAARAAEPLPIAFDAGNPPAMWGQGKAVRGVQPALIAAAAQEAGLTLRMSGMPWPRAMEGLARGEHCVGGAYRNAERAARYLFSESIREETVVAVALARNPLPALQQASDLRGLRVGLHRGWSYGEELDAALEDPALRVTRLTFGNRLFLALESGKVDVVLTDGDSVRHESRALREPVKQLAELSRNGTHLMCPRGEPFAKALAALNPVIRARRDSAAWAQLTQRELAR
ncbi:substrate-binding periplasmic protein [Inhella sp.]|uniref:substrate-binding periplasmic protein n=1 Tax=Inhella sp. TaxID=1921806 RepID=UPI0035AD9049